LIVPPGDARALAGAIARLLSEPESHAQFGAAAARRARSLFHPHEFQRATVGAILG
jgi:glycosyltransferase involved in cell wall biosynthesis